MATTRLGPHLRRVTFSGDALEGFEVARPASHVKLFLPTPGQPEPVLPTPGPDGPVYPEGAERPVVRTYTPRRVDAARRELDVDMVLHGTGAAADWAARAEPGDRAGVAGPGRGYEIDAGADWLLLVGDETALPAIATIVEALPPGARARALVELGDLADAQELVGAADLEVTWLPRAGAAAGQPMEDAVRRAQLPGGDGRVWVAGEAGAIRRIRAHLLDERGLDRDHVVTRGYWKQGTSNHPDHDYGD